MAILAKVSPADPLTAFRGGLVLVIAFFASAGVVSAVLLTRRAVRPVAGAAAVPAAAPAAVEVPAPAAEELTVESE